VTATGDSLTTTMFLTPAISSSRLEKSGKNDDSSDAEKRTGALVGLAGAQGTSKRGSKNSRAAGRRGGFDNFLSNGKK